MGGRIVVFGDIVDDIIATTAAPLRVDSDVDAEIGFAAGGSAANIAAWLGHLGADVEFHGRVGGGDGERHRGDLTALGVRAMIAEDAELPTSRIISIVHGDSRTFLVMNGASAKVGPALMTDQVLEGAGWLLFTGHSIRTHERLAQLPDMMRRARAHGVRVALDPSSAGFISDVGVDAFRDAIRGVDVLLPNRDEGAMLSGDRDPERAAAWLTDIAENVILTSGGAGAFVAARGAGVAHVASELAELIDPTGAGDAFDAGVLHALGEGNEALSAARAAVTVAARAVSHLGGRPRH